SGTFDLGSYTFQRSASGGTITVSDGGTLKIGGTNTFPANFTTHTLTSSSTVNYNGTNQTVSTESYGNLNLEGSGTKTMPSSAMILTNFTMNGTAAATAAAILTVNGNVTINSGSSFNASTFTHTF